MEKFIGNTEIAFEAYINEVLDKIQSSVSITDYEKTLIKEVVMVMNKPLPTTRLGAQTRLNELDTCRLKLTNLTFSISEKAIVASDEYRKVYEPEFVRLTRAGRPSQSAIESEMHLNLAIFDKRTVVNNYETVKSLLYGYIKTLDQIKQSVMKYDYNL